MLIIKKLTELQTYISKQKLDNKVIGFVPTLGALHDGHMSLIKKCNTTADISVCSIFVNPTQFNESSDLDKYPRTFEADSKLLQENGCDVLFYPSIKDVYPNGTDEKPDIDLKGLDQVLEGAFRPGHFDGVVQVVKRLLDMVVPDKLYMGQKDFQQFTIIQTMIDYFQMPVELVVCPIKREKSGLAMSSRNARLTKINKEKAVIINRTLTYVKRRLKTHSVSEVMEYAIKRMSIEDFRPEYFEIVDGKTLQTIKNMDKSDYIVACTAVWAGDIRLIDNKILKNTCSS